MSSYPIALSGLLIFLIAFSITYIGILINLKLLPGFISREKKEGQYRFEDIRKVDPVSTKLPHTGGIAALIGFSIALLLASNLGWVLAGFRWFLLPVWGFAIAGLIDDIKKTRGEGITQRGKLVFVIAFSFLLALILYFRFGFDTPYTPYSQVSYSTIPIIWFGWFIFISTTITSSTTLSVGFSDGIDGLLGGLWVIASLVYAIFTTINQAAIASAISFALVGSGIGFLLFNLPSAWASGKPRSQRRAQVYLGETGSMMVGSAFASLAILSQTELAWVIIGGVFVLEGATALYQAKILTPLFRRFLALPKHTQNGNGHNFPHTEFPLPFLATPYHCHLDLLGFGRLKIIYILWSLGLSLGILGIASILINELFSKVVIWLLGIFLIATFWLFGTWTKSVFLGLAKANNGSNLLTINRGRPFVLFGHKMYWTEEIITLPEAYLTQLGFLVDIVFWKSMSKTDALITIGYIYYHHGQTTEALTYWHRVPKRSLKIRSEIYHLYTQTQTLSKQNGIVKQYPEKPIEKAKALSKII